EFLSCRGNCRAPASIVASNWFSGTQRLRQRLTQKRTTRLATLLRGKENGRVVEELETINSLKPHEVSNFPLVRCGLRPVKTSLGMAARIGSASGFVGRGLIKRAPPKHSSNTALRPGMLRCERPNSLDLIFRTARDA